MILLAFVGMSLAWSFSWFAMRLQVDSFLPLELSVFYRFALTSLLMFALCFMTKQRMFLRKKEISYFIFIATTNFFANFLIGYFAVRFIASGVIATVFSLSIITSEIMSSIIDKRKMDRKVIISSFIGCIGLAFFIFPTINFAQYDDMIKVLTGFVLSIIMMIIYSAGTVMVARNKKINSTPLYTSIAYGSGIGSLLLLGVNFLRGNQFNFDYSAQYILSLSYLVIIASVIAFICLFYLIQKIGSAKANYTALVYPAIALETSSYFENFQFTILSAIGFFMILSALALEFVRIKKI